MDFIVAGIRSRSSDDPVGGGWEGGGGAGEGIGPDECKVGDGGWGHHGVM